MYVFWILIFDQLQIYFKYIFFVEYLITFYGTLLWIVFNFLKLIFLNFIVKIFSILFKMSSYIQM